MQDARHASPTDTEEIIALAKEEGYELTEEQLDGIAGGNAWDTVEEFLDHDCRRDMD